ncbi:DEAD (Asp-Glu-Ala-Asp) box polypeptide 59 [Phytophthora boehmeriae]|uniref:DEAD (Asp-Glu-Ala-Asp) box polypeptide 59 n=1 Tax=Phytophthora boehmeriae TaxID=109152 RepID=A0A8T1XCA5_9STRA|nr:DEAD (Asp-Glu-Ala-Asp) box polypeptide 59 [Phytophthora boehmeriae]
MCRASTRRNTSVTSDYFTTIDPYFSVDNMAEDSVVKRSADQRRPLQGEPICIVCGRYGEYVCDATDDDVCSLECRDLCQVKHQQQTQQSLQLQEQQAERADILRRKLGIQVVLKTASGAGSVVRETQLLPIPMVDFAQEQGTAKLPQELLMNLTANNFERPTPVQMQTIPCVLQGHNVLALKPTMTVDSITKSSNYLLCF